jgi:hypothetical protein
MSLIITYMSHVSYNDIHESCLTQVKSDQQRLIKAAHEELIGALSEVGLAVSQKLSEFSMISYRYLRTSFTYLLTFYLITWQVPVVTGAAEGGAATD